MTDTSLRVEIHTLGELSTSGADATRLAAYRKPLALLVLLAAEQTVARERAVGLLWGDTPPNNARHSLSQALNRLKSELPADCLDIGRDAIRTTELVWCDAVEFDAAIDAGRLDDALALYRGTFLFGFDAKAPAFAQWADRRAAHFALRLRDVMRKLIAESVGAQRVEDALGRARQWVQFAADEDEAQHRLIELLATTGRRSEALDHFELYRRALARDELKPLDETVALVERIRRGEALGPLTTMVRGAGPANAPRTRRFGGRSLDGPRLVRIADGGVEAESYFLRNGITRVGRRGCDLSFPHDDLLEEVHASIEVVPSAGGGMPRMTLRDETRANGVYLRVRSPWPLLHGDRFRVGQQQFRFEESEHNAAP